MTTQPPTPEEVKKLLERLKELHEKATQGEWSFDGRELVSYADPRPPYTICVTCIPVDSEYIAELRNNLPLLLALASQSLTATQQADALAEEFAASNKRREELHRRIKDLEFQLHGNDTFDKLTSLQAENRKLRWAMEKYPCSCLDGVDCDRCVALSSLKVVLTPPPDASGESAPSDAGKAGELRGVLLHWFQLPHDAPPHKWVEAERMVKEAAMRKWPDLLPPAPTQPQEGSV